MKTYEDYIGQTISIELKPSALFSYDGIYSVLRKLLLTKIKSELTYCNGLLCDFKDTDIRVEGNIIIVSGRVIQCEVDC